MAINFLQNVSLNNTELQNFKVQNLTGTPVNRYTTKSTFQSLLWLKLSRNRLI